MKWIDRIIHRKRQYKLKTITNFERKINSLPKSQYIAFDLPTLLNVFPKINNVKTLFDGRKIIITEDTIDYILSKKSIKKELAARYIYNALEEIEHSTEIVIIPSTDNPHILSEYLLVNNLDANNLLHTTLAYFSFFQKSLERNDKWTFVTSDVESQTLANKLHFNNTFQIHF